MWIWLLLQEAETLLQQLSVEQEEVDTLRAAVEEERGEIARETSNVARLAGVSSYVCRSVSGASVAACTVVIDIWSVGYIKSIVWYAAVVR